MNPHKTIQLDENFVQKVIQDFNPGLNALRENPEPEDVLFKSSLTGLSVLRSCIYENNDPQLKALVNKLITFLLNQRNQLDKTRNLIPKTEYITDVDYFLTESIEYLNKTIRALQIKIELSSSAAPKFQIQPDSLSNPAPKNQHSEFPKNAKSSLGSCYTQTNDGPPA